MSDEKDIKSSENKSISALDRVAKKILSTIDPTYNDKHFLTNRSNRLRSIMDRELQISKGISGGSIVDFVASMQPSRPNNSHSSNLSVNDTSGLFTQNISDVFGYFQDLQRNRFMEMSDLKFISKFIPALGEAVKTTLDMIASSDDQSETINRIIKLPEGVSDTDRVTIMNEIERIEREYKLLKKLKNTVYKKTLITGQYYVYTISYSQLFEEYEKLLKNAEKSPMSNQFGSIKKNRVLARDKKFAKESASDIDNSEIQSSYSNQNIIDLNLDTVTESVKTILSSAQKIKPDGNQTKLVQSEIDQVIKDLSDVLPSVKIDTTPIYFEALEGARALLDSNMLGILGTPALESSNTLDNLSTPDGTKDIDEISGPRRKYDIPGTYIKYIDSKNIVPAKIFDKVVGYYLIHSNPKKGKIGISGTNSISSIGNTIFSTVNVSERKKEEAINNIVQAITDGIIQNFSSKFVTANAEHKKLIADCIVANGITDTDYNIQFIPAEYIHEFKINENDEGYGESILAESLFPAKALLSVMVCRMLNFVNKTGNKTIAHIHKGPIDTYTANQINRVIRDLQDSDITFNDLLSPNLVFNKFNRDGKISIPTSKNGTKLVEFETQEGQTIDMSTEYENKLEAMAIMGSGVPSIIMDYTGSADLAKQYVSANIKYAGRIATHQADLEDPTTDLYKVLINNSTLPPKLKLICQNGLSVKLPRPKVLVNGNDSEFLRTIFETAGLIADVYLGESSNQGDAKKAELRNALVTEIIKMNSPYFDWEAVDNIYTKLEAETSKPRDKKNDSSDL